MQGCWLHLLLLELEFVCHPLSDSLLACGAFPRRPATLAARLCCQVARLLAAMRAGVHTLAEAHATVHTTAVAVVLPAGRKELPWPIRLDPKYDTEVVKLPERNRNPTYRVRLAGSEGGSSPVMVVVKLCRRYGAAAHRAWAELGLAPPVGLRRCCSWSMWVAWNTRPGHRGRTVPWSRAVSLSILLPCRDGRHVPHFHT